MIRVTVTLSIEGVIEALIAEGHAGKAPKGSNLVCAAFTVLLRTFAHTVESASGVVWSGSDDGERFQMAITGVFPEVAEQYRGWCSFLLRGFEDLRGEAPDQVGIEYGSSSGRLFHGS